MVQSPVRPETPRSEAWPSRDAPPAEGHAHRDTFRCRVAEPSCVGESKEAVEESGSNHLSVVFGAFIGMRMTVVSMIKIMTGMACCCSCVGLLILHTSHRVTGEA